MESSTFSKVEHAIRACSTTAPGEVRPEQSLVNDLAFDSMAMVRLGVALEDVLDRPILLDDWLRDCDDPGELTVASLCHYLEGGARDALVVPGG